MIHEILKEEIRVPGSMEETYLETFLLEITEKFTVQARPLVLVCPGGGYEFTSEREAEIVAMQFNAMGYHTAVLHYSCSPAVFPTALLELSKAVAYFRVHAAEWCIDPDKIAVLGFSAGGHLAASLGVFWNTEWFAKIREECGGSTLTAQSNPARDGISTAQSKPACDGSSTAQGEPQAAALTAARIKPNALILAYPVITSGEYAHRGSFDHLLGEKRCTDEFWLTKMSLEKQDLRDVPPTFLWHTTYDQSVPIENSLYFATALIKARKPVEYHVFPGDIHGISLADWRTRSEVRNEDTPASQWIALAHTWLENWRA